MTCFDVFNGDADGICSLVQLRLAAPAESTLITGVKRFVFLSTVKVNGEATRDETGLEQKNDCGSDFSREDAGHEFAVETAPTVMKPAYKGAVIPSEAEGSQRPLSEGRGGRDASTEVGMTYGAVETALTAVAPDGERDDSRESIPVAFSETDPPAPQDAYGQSKWEAEQALMRIADDSAMEVVIIRPPLVYGPGVKGNFASLLKWVKRGIPLPLGAIHNQRSLIALDNLVSFIELCLTHPKATDQTFVIADGEDVSTTELLQRVAVACGQKARLLPVPVSWMMFVARLLGCLASRR